MAQNKEDAEAGGRLIKCRQLPAFAPTDLDVARRSFQDAPSLTFRQSWLPKQEDDFRPATVRVAWKDQTLLIFAELHDADIFTRATAANQRLWELGDVFEIFLRPVEQEAYAEFQVAPNNQQLQLRYPNATAVESARQAGDFVPYLIPGEAFHSTTWVQTTEQRWFVLAEIPVASVCERQQPLAGQRWRLSFGRYDYTRGRKEPVVSCTSMLTKPDFHCQAEWDTMIFERKIQKDN